VSACEDELEASAKKLAESAAQIKECQERVGDDDHEEEEKEEEEEEEDGGVSFSDTDDELLLELLLGVFCIE
jgi:hypothetical protein